MKKIFRYVAGLAFVFAIASPLLSVATPAVTTVSANCDASVLGIPPWYRGLTDSNCNIRSPGAGEGQLQAFIWTIVLNVIQIALVAIAYLAIFFIMYGGFLFITGASNPSTVEKARKSIFNAVIGLVIALGAIAIVNFIFNIIGNAATDSNGIVQLTGEQLLQNILNIVYFVVGIIAIIVIILGGLMYTISSGDPAKVTRAKNMLTYSIVGLIIVIAAFAITNFVIENF